jgi:hypothetical protein
MEFVSGKPLQPDAEPRRRFRCQVIYLTGADVTVRCRSGAIVIARLGLELVWSCLPGNQ